MKVELWAIGKTAFPYLQEGMDIYEKRLKHYLPFQSIVLPDIKNAKNLSADQLKKKEAELVLHQLDNHDFFILLDERGKTYRSVELAQWMETLLGSSHRRVIFLIAGAFGADESLQQRANRMLSLSEMTFSHQMIRLFLLEQIYRSMTILKGEPYHNEG